MAPIDLAGQAVAAATAAAAAAFLPDLRTLLVADAHIGKAVSFRRLGVPVPEATTAGTLARLTRRWPPPAPNSVVFLGDLLHSARAHADGHAGGGGQRWRAGATGWTWCWCAATTTATPATRPPRWGVQAVDEPCAWGLALMHHPRARARRLCAGRPPAPRRGAGRPRARPAAPALLPLRAAVGVLPAFGEFTGMHPCRPARRPRLRGRAMPCTRCRAAGELPAAASKLPAMSSLESLLSRAESLLARLEAVLPHAPWPPDWTRPSPSATASAARGALEPVRHVAGIRLADLKEVDAQKDKLLRNTEQFVAGRRPTTCC
jgi:hypothetical protein